MSLDFYLKRTQPTVVFDRNITRFISSTNLWSKGRNSGLIACCNIIDEYINKEQP